MQIRHLNLAT